MMSPGYGPAQPVQPAPPLGPLVKHYGRSKEYTLSLLIASSLLLGGSAGVPILTALDDSAVNDDAELWIYILSPLGIAAGLAGFIWLLVHLGEKLDVYQLGFVHRGKRVVRWEEIEAVTSRIYEVIGGNNSGTKGHVTLWLQGGRKLKLTPSLDQVADARGYLQAATFDRMMGAARGSIASGRPVSFGPLWVSAQGLGRGAEMQPWPAFQELRYEEGKFTATLTGGSTWAKLRRDKLLNVHVFLPLVSSFHDVRGL